MELDCFDWSVEAFLGVLDTLLDVSLLSPERAELCPELLQAVSNTALKTVTPNVIDLFMIFPLEYELYMDITKLFLNVSQAGDDVFLIFQILIEDTVQTYNMHST